MLHSKLLVAVASIVFLSICYCATSQCVGAESESPFVSEVATLEHTLYGSSTNARLINRVQHLEETTFGKVQTGAISTRIHALERVLLPRSGSGIKQGNGSESVTEPGPGTLAKSSDKSKNQADRVTTWLKSGVAAEQRGDDTSARQDFENVVQIDPGNADAYYNLGALAEKSGDLKAASVNYRRVLQCKPGDTDAMQAADSIERRLAFNRSVPAPFQIKQTLNVARAQTPTISVTDRKVSRTVSVPIMQAKVHTSHFHAGAFTRHLLQFTAATAVTVLNNSTVDRCACR